MTNPKELQIATIGKVVALRGELKLHLQSDFVSQFDKGRSFVLTNGKSVEIEYFKESRMLVKFVGFNTREDASTLTNQKLFTTIDKTRDDCPLDDGEFYWFDVIGSTVYDDGQIIGKVLEIERIGVVDYLVVETSQKLVLKEFSKKFYIPYIDEYILSFDKDSNRVETKGGLLLLEAS